MRNCSLIKSALRTKPVPPQILPLMLKVDESTGHLYWKHKPRWMFDTNNTWAVWNSRYAGKRAFTAKDSDGYYCGQIHGRRYVAHRVIFALLKGRWPEDEMDHINRDKSDNRPCNLREANKSQNMANYPVPSTNTSGVKGVSWNRARGKWMAQLMVRGKYRYLGYFTDLEEARKVVVAAREELQKEFAYHG